MSQVRFAKAACDFSRHHGEGRNRGEEERLQVVAADDNRQVRLGLFNILAQLPHRGDVGVQLLRNLRRRPDEQLRRVHGGDGGDYLSHNSISLFQIPFTNRTGPLNRQAAFGTPSTKK